MIDVQKVVEWMTQVGVILGVMIAAYKLIDKHLIKRFAALEGRIDHLDKWTSRQQEDIDDGAERDRIILDGVLACLKGLHEQGCNGAVTIAIENIDAYITDKAYKTSSKQKPYKSTE